MKLITQSVDTANVRRDTLNGREHLVAPTIAVKPSDELHGGYVPSSEFQKAASDWNGRPITLGHPTNPRGQLISANDPSVVENVALGGFYNAEFEPSDDSTRGELWLDVQKARDMGGAAEQALEMLENGDPLEVSTGYRAQPGDPGEYDGEYRQNVQVDIHPDHVAVLPNSTGRCSWDDGCGAPRVNADTDHDPSANDADPATVVEDYDDASLSDDLTLHADSDDTGSTDDNDDADRQVRANVRSSARRPSYSGTSESDWSKPTLDDYVSGLNLGDIDSVDDLSGDQKTQIAEMTLLGESGADSFEDLSFFPVVEPSSNSLNRNGLNAVRGGRGSQADIPEDARESAQNMAGTLLEEEFDADVNGNANGEVDQNAAVRALHRFANAMGVSMDPEESDADADGDQDPDDAQTDDDGDDNDSQESNTNESDSDPDDCGCGGHSQKGNCDCDDHDDAVLGNQQEGDRVRWDSDAGTSREPDDVRYGIVVDLLQDGPEDEVKVAVYAPDSEEGEWTATGSDVNVSRDNLTVIDQFPAIDQVNANNQNTNMSQNYDLETLIANSAFDADELRDDDELRNKVADTLSITGNDSDGDSDGDAEDDDQNQPEDDDGEDDSDDADADAGADDDTIESLQATVESLAATVEEQNQTIEQIQANEKQEREEKRERLKSQIKANSSSYSDEQLDEAGDDLLESIANDVAGGMADLSARSPTSIPAQRSNSSDADDYSAGTMADYKEQMAANEGGD